MSSTLVRLACVLAVCVFATVRAEEKPAAPPAPPKDPLRSVKPVESGQFRLGDQIHKTSDAMRDLLEDLQQNIGVDLNDKDHVKNSTTKLDKVSTETINQVIDALVAARKGTEQSEGKERLKVAVNSQDEVIKQLNEVLRRMKKELNHDNHRLLTDAIKKQEEAIAKTKETRVRKELEAKPVEKLNEEEKKAIAEANEKQKDATEELKKAEEELKSQIAEAKKRIRPRPRISKRRRRN